MESKKDVEAYISSIDKELEEKVRLEARKDKLMDLARSATKQQYNKEEIINKLVK